MPAVSCTPRPEDCGNGADDDCDSLIDCQDGDCTGNPSCDSCVPGDEGCTNGSDDDCDGLADCSDPDCSSDPACAACPPEQCGNGVDDDCDGLTDCNDPDCQASQICHPCVPDAESCANGTDDDCDGLPDCNDPDCFTDPACLTCIPYAEICGNGQDENCNGLVDDGCVYPCEEEEGDNCNDDGGGGDRCAPEENTNGCSDAKFWAWCNRSNPNYPDIWDDFLRGWVEARCDGTTELLDPDGDGYPTYTCINSSGRVYECTTPLVLLFDPRSSVACAGDDGAGDFDLEPSKGGDLRTDWPTAATPWLALDRNGDGIITDGSELFGSATAGVGQAPANGFEALSALDSDGDGDIDGADEAFGDVLVWADADGDRFSSPWELASLADLGIESLGLDYLIQPRCDARGNCEIERGPFSWKDAAGAPHEGVIVDIHLAVRTGQDTSP